MALNICSFNCRGLKGSVTDLSVLAKSFEIICLQETWLMPSDLGILKDIVPEMIGFGISGMDDKQDLHRGRPRGGVAIMWHKALAYSVSRVYSGYNWLTALQLADNTGIVLTVINAYLPCDSHSNVDQYLDCLGKIVAFTDEQTGPFTIVGDFNCNPNNTASPCGKILNDFQKDFNVIRVDSCLPTDSHTFVSDVWHSTSWLDHCFASKCLLDKIKDCWIVYDCFNSDHLPIAFSVNIPPANINVVASNAQVSARLPKINLGKVKQSDIEKFQSFIFNRLNEVGLCNLDVLCCCSINCDRNDHKAQIDVLYSHLTSCLTDAVSLCFKSGKTKTNHKKSVPGWNDFVLEARKSASDAYKLWQQWNKPKHGPLFDLMQRTRAHYKYAVRFCRKHEQQIEADNYASCLAQKNYNCFWKTVSRSRTPGSAFTSKVGSAEGPTDVCSLWLNHYKTLFNSVPYDCSQMEKLVSSVAPANNEAIEHVSSRDISATLDAMLNNKAAGIVTACALSIIS